MCIKFPLQFNIDIEVVSCLPCYYKVSFLKERFRFNTTCCLIELFMDSCFLFCSMFLFIALRVHNILDNLI